jgi:hypothetical protein
MPASTTDHRSRTEAGAGADALLAARPASGCQGARAEAVSTWLDARVGAPLYIVWQTPELTPAIAFSATLARVSIVAENSAEPVRVTLAFADAQATAVTLVTDEVRAVDTSPHALRVAHRHGYIILSTR